MKQSLIKKSIQEYFHKRSPGCWLTAAAFSPLLAVLPMSEALAQNQPAQSETLSLEEIVVTARRRDEGLQEVPLTVNVVNAQALEELNLRRLEDIQAVVPGLTMTSDSIAPNASLRGVRFDTYASGFNSTVEFYLNDAPINTSSAMQAMFDVGQIEVLRGPQGTLRGRAAPSGSITITTQRPDLEEFGGYIDATATNKGGKNLRGALNIPLIQDKLALRVAGMMEENEGNWAKSIHTGSRPKYETDGYRVSLRYEPTDNLSVNLMHQRVKPERREYGQVESAYLRDSSLAPSPSLIKPGDRLSVADTAGRADSKIERTGLEVEWDLGGVQVNYVGAVTDLKLERAAVDDDGDFFGADFPEDLQGFGQELVNKAETESHELRFAFNQGRFDYLIGGFYQKTEPNNTVLQKTPVFMFMPAPGTFATVAETPVQTGGESVEKSLFGNVTFHITDATELSAGLRYIKFDTDSQVNVAGNIISSVDEDWSKTIYTVSLKHQFTDDIMAYISAGSSWRPGVSTVGNFNTRRSPLEESFVTLDPETSDSYEVGLKTAWLDNRLRLNGTMFYQEFKKYPYRAGGAGSGGDGVFYVSTDPGGVESVESFNFVAAVPVEVYGLELEASYQATERWNMGAVFSWARGRIDGGTIPCNVYGGSIPSIADIRNATGGDNVASCQSNARANFAPLWTASIQSEYAVPLDNMDAYVRGLLTLQGDSKNNPDNPYDDISSYGILNLYTGVRSTDRKWDLMVFVKNVFNTEKVLSRDSTSISQGYQVITGFGPDGSPITEGQSGTTPWRSITMTQPREVGLNVRYNF